MDAHAQLVGLEIDHLSSRPEDWDASSHVQSRGTELRTLMGADGSFEAINVEAAHEVTPVEGAGGLCL